jgi:hypothetical protein
MHPIDHDIAVILPANRRNYSLVASPLEQEGDEEVPEATKSPSVFFSPPDRKFAKLCFEVALNHKMAFC